MQPLNPVEATVTLAGKQIHFVELKLEQHFYQSHHAEILVDFEELDVKWLANPISLIKYIGDSLNITFKHKISGDTYVFSGIVTNVTMKGRHGTQNHILIQGADPSVKLSDSPTMDSFVNMPLNDIVKEAVGYSGNGTEITVDSNFTKPIDFVYQYGETCHQLLLRLCHNYGENYYYNGTQLIFGKTIIGDTIPIKYDVEMTDYVLEANLLPSNFKHYAYLSAYDEKWEKETQPEPESTGYLKIANDRSDEIYATNGITPLDATVNDSDAILDIVKAKRKKIMANMLRLRGTTQTCKVGIGNIIIIDFPPNMQVETTEGEFIVTDVVHTVDQQGHYKNEFSSVRKALNQVPMPTITLPTANPQQAKVTSNADPKNQGRIQVEFQWQEARGKTTNYIKVQTPDAGGSDKVSSNRGLVTIPEEGDTVMVGFEFGNPDKPFSMGSLFSSKNGGGGGQGNKTKSLTTRSGSAMSLDDDKGSATLKDASGNIIELDGAGNINITVPNTITIKAKDIKLDAGNSVVIDSGSDGDGTITINAKKSIEAETETEGISLASEQTLSLESRSADLKMDASTDFTIDATDIEVTSSGTLNMSSGDTNIM